MKIELRSIKVHASMSEETTCYEAVLYVDGKKACMVSNRGRGGCDDQRWLPGAPRQAVEDHFDAMPAYVQHYGDDIDPFETKPDLESWCSDQITVHGALKDYKRAIRKNVVVGDGASEVTFRAAPPASDALRAHIRSKYPEGVILNDLGEDGLRDYINAAIARDRKPVSG